VNEWALCKNNRIVNVVTTSCSLQEMRARYFGSGYYIVALNDLPLSVKQQYQYWEDRP
jgi:hypothetical protein